MLAVREYRHQPADSRRRGLPAIGFSIQAPTVLDLEKSEPIAPTRATLLIARERGADNTMIGELGIGAFSAALIMDRDGILRQMVEVELERALTAPAAGRREGVVPMELDTGAQGFRGNLVLLRDAAGTAKPTLPYLSLCALGTTALIDAGLFVTMRTAQPSWPAGEQLLGSLLIVRQGGSWHARAATDELHLPVLGRRR